MYCKRVEETTNTLIELVFENENRKQVKFECECSNKREN